MKTETSKTDVKTETKTDTTNGATSASASGASAGDKAKHPFAGFPFLGFDPSKLPGFAGFDASKLAFDPKNPFAAFDPLGYWAASQQLFSSAMADAQARMTSTLTETQARMSSSFADAQARMASFADKLSALDPNPYFAAFRDAMAQATTKMGATAESTTAQYAQLETQLIERAHSAVATWAQLAHDAITYGAQLSTEARKLGSDAAKKMGAQA